MSKQQFIWVGAVIALGFGILICTQGRGNYMMAELIGAGLPVALFGIALIAVGAAFIRKKKMKSVASFVIAITAVGAYPLSYADIYKCTINGEVFFSAEKCGHDAVKINIDSPPDSTIQAGSQPTNIGLGPTSQPAMGDGWVKIAESKDGKQISLIDKDSIKVVDGMVRHWTKLEDYSSAGILSRKTIHRRVTDCKAETQASTSMHSYENGSVVFSYSVPPDTKLNFSAYPPSTLGAYELAFICRIFKNGWLPFPQLEGTAQWEEIPGHGTYFLDRKSIEYVGPEVRYQVKSALNSGNGYVIFKMATNCNDSTSAISQRLSFDVSKKFEPEFSINLEVERPPLKLQRADTEPGLKYVCEHVRTKARVGRGSKKSL